MNLRRALGDPIPRAPGVPPRAVRLAFLGRFADELLFGATDVLMPTIRATFGLSYAQVGFLHLALQYVAGLVEPLSALLIDVWERRWLLAWGAAGIGLSTVMVGVAPTFAVLVLAFAVYGLSSGPLAHTADVVLVQAHPAAPGRAFARATALDTTGALLGPALVAAWLWAGLEWRWLLVLLGLAGIGYAALLAGTRFPAAAPEVGVSSEEREDVAPRLGLARELLANLRAVARDRAARTWLLFLFVHEVVEAPIVFRAIWLSDEGGMSQVLVGVYVLFETFVALVAVLALDRWLTSVPPRRLMLVAALGLLVLYPAWYLLPGTWARFLVGAPLGFLFALFWPIARSESLTTASGRPGAVTAVSAVLGLLPLALVVALLAEAVGLTAALLGTQLLGMAALALVTWRWLPVRTAAHGPTD
ncbi:MAG: MFS transporter [Dehalococcoidia bacterium]|nr:MFS transporter [Dehalococcoidia bacterium]